MAVTDDATILATTNADIRVRTLPSSVTKTNVAANIDQLTNSKVSRLDRPLTPQGAWIASGNTVPSNGDATVLKGYFWDGDNSSSTTLLDAFGNPILPFSVIRALVDNPGSLLSDRTKWSLTYSI